MTHDGRRRGWFWLGAALAALLWLGGPVAQADDPPPPADEESPDDKLAEDDEPAPAPGDIVDVESLPGVTVLAPTLTKRELFETTASVNVITPEILRRELPRSASEAVRFKPGLWAAESGHGQMGTPSIRGIMGNEVLLLFDGLRMNTSLTPTGPGPDWDLIDMDLIDRIEVLRTPDSVIYGTDALGGVTAYYTGWPVDYTTCGKSFGGRLGFILAAHGQNQRRYTAQGWAATPNARVMAAIGYVDADDMIAGGSAGKQSPTWYKSGTALFKAEGYVSRRDTLGFTFFGMRKDFDGHFLFPSRVQNTDHRREAGILRWYHDRAGKIADNLEVRLGLAHNYRLIDRTDVIKKDEFSIYAPQLDVVAHKQAGHHGLTYGAMVRGEDLTASVATPTSTISSVPDSQTLQAGVFLQDEWDINRRTRLTGGARFDYVRVKTDPDPAKTDPLVNPDDIRIDRSDTALTGKLGLLYLVNTRVSVTGNVSRGYRFPNAADLAAFRQAPDEIVVGNPDLKPEYSTSIEAGVHLAFPRLRANAVAYRTWYDNLIIGRPGVFNGQTWADRNGNGVEDSDEGFYLRQNAGSAATAGFEADAECDLTCSLLAYGNLTIWDGTFDPKPHEPLGMPTNATLGLRYHPTTRWWVLGEIHFVSDFSDIDPAFYNDEAFFRRDPHDPSKGTLTDDHTVPGFTTVDLRAGADVGRRLHLTAGIENLFDVNYRWYGARHDAPGITFLFGAALDL